MKAKIIGTGSYLPERVLTNFDLEKLVDTTNEWIISRTGMQERRIAKDDEYTSDMGLEAAKRAIEDAKLDAKDIDFILVSTLTPDYIFPSTACLIQEKLGTKNTPGMDIQAACSGYIYALNLAKSFVEAKIYKNVLVIASDKVSSIVDYQDRSTCVLFGDGASACIVSGEADREGLVIEGVSLGGDGCHANLLQLPGGGSRNPATVTTIENKLHFLKMSGGEVFKHAVRCMAQASKECLAKVNLTEADINWLIPHQANLRIIDAIAKRFKHLPTDRIYKEVVQKFGNTSASSVGIALDRLLKEKKIKHQEKILLTAFGAGLTWGSAVLSCLGEKRYG